MKRRNSDTFLCDLAIQLGDIWLLDELGKRRALCLVLLHLVDSTRLSSITILWGGSARMFYYTENMAKNHRKLTTFHG